MGFLDWLLFVVSILLIALVMLQESKDDVKNTFSGEKSELFKKPEAARTGTFPEPPDHRFDRGLRRRNDFGNHPLGHDEVSFFLPSQTDLNRFEGRQ